MLGYDQTAIGTVGSFTTPQYNGNIAGANWRSKGDGTLRKFDYHYDALNRITAADFNEYAGGSYNKSNGLDFSESNYHYDLNGNILSVNRKGWQMGGSTDIDQLSYTYFPLSNKLQNVIDGSQDPTSKLGDFHYTQRYHDELGGTKTTAAQDYYYDADGNMVSDLNKYIGTTNVNGITYNHLNLPKQVTLYAELWEWVKGTVEYIYTADGQKLGKVVRESPYWTPSITYYLPGIVYQNDSLQFISHPEGRTRFQDPQNRSKGLTNDFFIADHLGNIRMVLTEQKDTTVYMATLEAAYRSIEETLFDHLPSSSYPTASVPGGYPEPSGNDSIARVNGSGQKVGPSLLFRVMSGDEIDLSAKSYYLSRTGSITNTNPIPDILTTLANGLTGLTNGTHGSSGNLGNPLTSPLLPALNFMRSDVNTATPNQPKAWLNWVLLDERLQIVPEGSGGIHVGSPDAIRTLAQTGITVPKNGYLYVYVSNETELWDVFFDDIRIAHRAGPIVEETHYYPFGLTIQALSSKAANRLKNSFKYNGKEEQRVEFSDGSGLEWLDYGARMYDNQLGRWQVIDPMADQMRRHSPFNYAFDNPIRFIDPDGMAPDWIVGTDGKKVTHSINKDGSITWSANASEDVKRAGNLMAQTEVGREKLQNLSDSELAISIKIDTETINNENGTFGRGKTEYLVNEKGKLVGAEITIFETTIKEQLNYVTDRGEIPIGDKKYKAKELTSDDVLGSTAVHESTHATDARSNRFGDKNSTPSSREIKPNENQQKHLDELIKKKKE